MHHEIVRISNVNCQVWIWMKGIQEHFFWACSKCVRLFEAIEFGIWMTSRTENAKHFILKPYAVCTYSYVYMISYSNSPGERIFFMFEWSKGKERETERKLSFPAFHIIHFGTLWHSVKIFNDHMLCSPFVFIQYHFQLRIDFISFPAHWNCEWKTHGLSDDWVL